jgi:hypothetical protein
VPDGVSIDTGDFRRLKRCVDDALAGAVVEYANEEHPRAFAADQRAEVGAS